MAFRFISALMVMVFCLAPIRAQSGEEVEPAARYDIEANLRTYPQGSAKETLASVIRGLEAGRFSYVAAQLADPNWTDRQVKDIYSGDFDALVKAISTKLANSPATVREMDRFLKEGDWEGTDTSAVVKHKEIRDRQIAFKKIGKRWYMENPNKRAEK